LFEWFDADFTSAALILKHELADGEFVRLRRRQQLRGAVKRKRNGRLLLLREGSTPSSVMKPPPMEKKVRSPKRDRQRQWL